MSGSRCQGRKSGFGVRGGKVSKARFFTALDDSATGSVAQGAMVRSKPEFAKEMAPAATTIPQREHSPISAIGSVRREHESI